MKFKAVSLVAGLATCFALASAAAPDEKPNAAPTDNYRVGDKLEPGRQTPPTSGTFNLITWEALVPKDWNPMKGIDMASAGRFMRDGDPEATAALEKLKRAWSNAPTEPAMNKARVRIAGFAVPLETSGAVVQEFLLVPYFGACIHTPPPPANQIIHVTLATPVKDIRMMQAVWVNGQLNVATRTTGLGTSAYSMDGHSVAPYQGNR